MHWGSIRLASCSCRIVSISFVLLRFTCIGAILDQRIPSAVSHKIMFVLCVDTHLDSSRLTSCCCGVARIHAFIAFYTNWRTIRLTSCIWGIARIHFCYCILHALGYYQTCDLFCGIARTQIFYCVLHAFGQGQANVLLLQDHRNSSFLFGFTHIWKSIRLRSCFCRIARIYFLLCFTRIRVISD